VTIEGEYFIEDIYDLSIKCWDIYKVLPSLFIGQSFKESGYGDHIFYNNYLGIKCHDTNLYAGCRLGKTNEVISGVLVPNLKLAFQCYNNYEECMHDYGTRLHLPKYKNVLTSDNYWDASYWVIKGGYATGLTYLSSLRKDYIEKQELYLYDGFVKGRRNDNNNGLYYSLPNTLEGRYNFKLEDNFKYGEFWQKDGKEPNLLLFNNIVWIAKQLQIVRNAIQLFYNIEYKIKITSCIRDALYNRKNNGKEGSNHLMGLAVDIQTNLPLYQLLYFIIRYSEFTGIGIFKKKNYLHLDFGNLKPLKIWEG